MKGTDQGRLRLLGGIAVAAVAAAGTPVAAHNAAPPPTPAQGEAGPADTAVRNPETQAEDAGRDGASADIIVTGSRIPSGFDRATPVTVLGAEEITRVGNVNIDRTLTQLPQALGSTTGSSFSNQVPNGGYADVNLRGFGSNRNLVLVNGRRFTIFGPSGVTDLNTIPTTLIARTEIVTGGSSAVYGSDAITGVVNFILRDDFEGVEGRAQANLSEPTGTPTYNFDLTIGRKFAEGRGNITVSGNYLERKGFIRSDVGFARDVLIEGCVRQGTARRDGAGLFLAVPGGQTCAGAGGELGFYAGGSGDIPNGRFSGIPASGGGNAALNAAYAAAGLSGLGARGFTFNDQGTVARPALTPQDDYNNSQFNYVQQPQKRYMVNAFAHYDFSDAATLYGEFHYSRNEVIGQFGPNNPGGTNLFDVNNPYASAALREVFRQLDLAETGPMTVTTGTTSRVNRPGDGLVALTAGRRFSELGPRVGVDKRDAYRGAIGLRGDLGDLSETFLTDLTYDAYYTYSRSENDTFLTPAVSRSRLQAALLSQNGANPVCNIFGQNLSAACAAAISADVRQSTEATLQVAQASVAGKLLPLPAGPVGFSLGAEWRRLSARFTPDPSTVSGDIAGFDAGLPTAGAVKVFDIFGELRIPLIHDTPFIESLTANAGFRHSKYNLDGIGGTWTYLGGLEWRVSPDLVARGQYQRAIRAPNVQELYGGRLLVALTATDPCSSRANASLQTAAVRTLCAATGVPAPAVFGAGVQPNAILLQTTGGNPDLSEETSDTYTAGVVLTPRFIPRLSLSIDYFDIKLNGAIAPLGSSLQSVLNLCYYTVQDAASAFCRAVQRDPATGAIVEPYAVQLLNVNTGSLKTSGVDFALRYSLPTSRLGRFDLLANWTYTDEFTIVPVSSLKTKNECVGSFGGTCGQPVPKWKGVTSLSWTLDNVSITARERHISSVTNDRYLVPLRQGAANVPALSSLVYPVLPSVDYLDLSFSIDTRAGFRFFGGVNNVFGTRPPLSAVATTDNAYVATYDALGREFFLGVNAKF